ncbi:MAG: hypothetical protein Q7S59_05770 [Sulfurimonas sp.]|nr:hypothetical protein [Sulfurimonas sp.]
MILSAQQIKILAKHLSLAHHIKGRVRFKVDPKIQHYSDQFDLEVFCSLDKKVEGIKSVNLNKIARSITIEYNPAILSQEFWFRLLDENRCDELSMELANLTKEEE